MTLMQTIMKLLPPSKRWLIQKGYLELVKEDGVPTLRVTDAGRRYFSAFKQERT